MQLIFRGRRTAALVVAVALFIALAGSVVPAQAAVDARLAEMNIGYLGTGMSPVLIVSSTLPTTVDLPAEVEFSVPEGATVAWYGELAGTGDSADDVTREYELDRTEDGWDIYRATVTEFRSFQVEASVAPAIAQAGGGNASGVIKYSPAMSADTAFLGVEVPTGYTPTNAAGFTLLGQGLNGEVWGQPYTPLEAGQEVSYEFGYTPGAPSGGGGAASGSTNVVVTVLVVGAVVILMGLIGYAVYRRMGNA